MIRFSRSWRHCIRNLVTEKQNNNLTTTENMKVMNKSMSKNGFLRVYSDSELLLFFWWLIKYSQTCIRRPLLGPLKSGRLGKVAVEPKVEPF